MTRTYEYIIDSKHNNITVSCYLREHLYTHQIITLLKHTENSILVNNIWVHVNHCLSTGDILHITVPEIPVNEKIEPCDIPLDIIFEDEDIVIINKPAGMPIHPSLKHYTGTLANALTYYYLNEKSPFIFRCINRLDRDTTGITIVAKNIYSAAVLSAQMRNRQIKRTYIAIVEDILNPSEGCISAPIARVNDSIITRCVDFENGERAVTNYKVLNNTNSPYGPLSFVELHLETGKTHQIRVHMSYLGHPLIGDFLYNPDSAYNELIGRQALHASKIQFTHPITGKFMSIVAPLPKDMVSIENLLH